MKSEMEVAKKLSEKLRKCLERLRAKDSMTQKAKCNPEGNRSGKKLAIQRKEKVADFLCDAYCKGERTRSQKTKSNNSGVS